MTIEFQSILHFHRDTGMSVSEIKKRLDIGNLPEIPRENPNGTRYIDLEELRERKKAGQFYLIDLRKAVKKSDKS